MRKLISFALITAFISTSLYIPKVQAGERAVPVLPAPGTMVDLSPAYVPVLIKGLKVHPENPLVFDFIIDTGRSGLNVNSLEFKASSEKIIKYFLASLTIKEDDRWVNLSPYEKDKIIPDELGKTELGRDMLAQDYILKQLTASLIYPEKKLGKEFWNKIYSKALQMYGTSLVPVNTFNKVWIVADKAKILERGNAAYVVGSHLKVMLEEDYLAVQKHAVIAKSETTGKTIKEQLKAGIAPPSARNNTNEIVRELILPEIEKEVNQGQSFASLRQMYYSMILAAWYKLTLKDALLNQVYADKGKISGVHVNDPTVKDQIYQQYLQAYKKGVFNYIKDDIDSVSKQRIPRKYFSGGVKMGFALERNLAILHTGDIPLKDGDLAKVVVNIAKSPVNKAMITPAEFIKGVKHPYLEDMLSRLRAVSLHIINPKIIEQLNTPENIFSSWSKVNFNGEKIEFFHTRILNNTVLGPGKGGIRWVLGSDLMKDEEFRKQLNKLNKLSPKKSDVENFIRTWIEGEANALALGMTLKDAGSGLSLGGGKAAVFIGKIVQINIGGDLVWTLEDYDKDWNKNSLIFKALIARRHALEMARSGKIGPKLDIPAPDMRTTAQILSWYEDEYLRYLVIETDIIKKELPGLNTKLKSIKETNDPTATPYLKVAYDYWIQNKVPVPWLGVFTGKPLGLGGVSGRSEATGHGVVDVMETVLGSLSGLTFAVNGFGNVGYFTCEGLLQKGAKLKVINDLGITLIKETGWTLEVIQSIEKAISEEKLTLREVWESGHVSKEGVLAVLDTNKDKHAAINAVLSADVNVLVPAAKDEVITEKNESFIRAQWIFEGANGPTTVGAEEKLAHRVNIVPDLLVNVGGVTVSSFETEQTSGDHPFTLDEVRTRRKKSLQEAIKSILEIRQRLPQVSFREAFYIHAMNRINEQQNKNEPPKADHASLAQSPGGIDLNTKNLTMDVSKEGLGVTVTFDQALVAEFRRGDFSGIEPVIISITPIQNPLMVN